LNSIERYSFEASLDKINPLLKFQIPCLRAGTNIQIISNHQYPNLSGDLNLVIEYYLEFVISLFKLFHFNDVEGRFLIHAKARLVSKLLADDLCHLFIKRS